MTNRGHRFSRLVVYLSNSKLQPVETLYLGKRPSSITPHHRNGAAVSIMAPRRFYRNSPALQQIERAIEAVFYPRQTTTSTHIPMHAAISSTRAME